MSTRLTGIVVDATDPQPLADYWAALLDWPITLRRPDEVELRAPDRDGLRLELTFVPVPERKLGPNRMHLDLASRSVAEQAERVARGVALGGARIDIGQRDVPWEVLADPEGNEFCVREPEFNPDATGQVAAIPVDAEDPAHLAAFWMQAAGWRQQHRGDDHVALCSPSGKGPRLEFWRFPRRSSGKNRWHFDVAPWSDADQSAEVDRLVGLGARPIDVGQRDVPWVVLADPEGNEFCVLTSR